MTDRLGVITELRSSEMTPPILLNSLGLIFDIIGVFLLWLYGLSAMFTVEGEVLTAGNKNVELMRKVKKHRFRGRIGIGALLLGFILQLASNFLR